MRYAHSTRSTRKPPRASEDYEGIRGFSVGYDSADLEELTALIAARIKTPRAELGRPNETASATRRDGR